jgi:hypothetical protein
VSFVGDASKSTLNIFDWFGSRLPFDFMSSLIH